MPQSRAHIVFDTKEQESKQSRRRSISGVPISRVFCEKWGACSPNRETIVEIDATTYLIRDGPIQPLIARIAANFIS